MYASCMYASLFFFIMYVSCMYVYNKIKSKANTREKERDGEKEKGTLKKKSIRKQKQSDTAGIDNIASRQASRYVCTMYVCMYVCAP